MTSWFPEVKFNLRPSIYVFHKSVLVRRGWQSAYCLLVYMCLQCECVGWSQTGQLCIRGEGASLIKGGPRSHMRACWSALLEIMWGLPCCSEPENRTQTNPFSLSVSKMGDWRWGSRECLWITKLYKQHTKTVCVSVLAWVMCIICPHPCLLLCVWLCPVVIVVPGVNVEPPVLHEFETVASGPGRGVLLFPEICTMELQLLTTGSPDLEVLSHVFHSLLSAVQTNRCNAALLYNQVRVTTSSFLDCSFFCLSYCAVDRAVRNMTNFLFWSSQGGVKTILSGFHNILSQTDPSFTGLLFHLTYVCLIWHYCSFVTSKGEKLNEKFTECWKFLSSAANYSTGLFMSCLSVAYWF